MIGRIFEDLKVIFHDLGMMDVYLKLEEDVIHVEDLQLKLIGGDAVTGRKKEFVFIIPHYHEDKVDYETQKFVGFTPRTFIMDIVLMISNKRVVEYLRNAYPMGFDLGIHGKGNENQIDDIPF